MKTPTNEETCQGLFFKCQNCYFESKGAYCQSVKFVPLKRKSCTGCEKCENYHDDLKELKYKFLCKEPIHGKVYQLKMTNIILNEDGYAEDWDLEFVLIEEET